MKSSGFFLFRIAIIIFGLLIPQLSVSQNSEAEAPKAEAPADPATPTTTAVVVPPKPPVATKPKPIVKPEASVVSTQSSDIFLTCSRQKEMRWLRAFKLDNGRCKAYYSKEGYVQVISSASYFASCEAVMNSVKKNIEEGGFKCSQQLLSAYVEIE